tara:strand:- start:120 stop:281 length:162 start_codon:yes stop_codon:yes gene_type:complete
MKFETIDLSNKCVCVVIYCGIWYNRKDIIEKYEISNVSKKYVLHLQWGTPLKI